MKLLITGSNGQVGRALCALAADQSIDYQAFSSEQLDITKDNRVFRALRKAKPSLVVNAAAYTAVDRAEDEAEKCYAVNRDGVHYLAKACSRLNIPLIHISTDYVFDGQKSAAYVEGDSPNPINVYGASKLEGEKLLRATLSRHVILRVSWVFSEWGNNFVKTMTRLSREKDELRVVDDQVGSPTPASDIARVIIAMARQFDCGAMGWGTYHYTGAEISSWCDFSKDIIAEAANYGAVSVKGVYPEKTENYNYRAKRPLNSQMNCRKILEAFGIRQRSWKPEMARVVRLCSQSEGG